MRTVRALVVATLAALALAACGGAPVAFTDLPQYPDAAELQAGESPIADSVAETMRSSVGGLASDVKIYQLPAGTDFAAVREYYGGQLGGADWASSPELDSDAGSFSTAGWQRGAGGGEQVLMLGYMPELLGDPPVLIVSLFSE